MILQPNLNYLPDLIIVILRFYLLVWPDGVIADDMNV